MQTLLEIANRGPEREIADVYRREIERYNSIFGLRNEITDFEINLCNLAHAARKDKYSVLHRFDHHIRDARYSDLIMQAESLQEYKESAYIFAYLHDIGREGEGYEPWHGRVGARKVYGVIEHHWPHADVESIVWAIENHSNIVETSKNGPIDRPSQVDPTIFYIGSDADQLDLIRDSSIGVIKKRYLHYDSTKMLANSKGHHRIYVKDSLS